MGTWFFVILCMWLISGCGGAFPDVTLTFNAPGTETKALNDHDTYTVTIYAKTGEGDPLSHVEFRMEKKEGGDWSAVANGRLFTTASPSGGIGVTGLEAGEYRVTPLGETAPEAQTVYLGETVESVELLFVF